MKASVVSSAYVVVACLCSVLFPDAAEARTVALWPIEWNENTQWIDARCRIDPTNDFTCSGISYRTDSTPGTELPSNPSVDVPEDFACNYISYHSNANSAQNPHYTSYGVSRYMTLTNDFTVEFFFKVDTLPAAGGVAILAGFNPEENGTGDRWFVSLRRTVANADRDEFYWNIYGHKRTDGDVNSSTCITTNDAVAYFAQWHHAAVVFQHDQGNGKNWTGFYIDANLVCEDSQPVVPTYPTQKHTKDKVVFGGRAGSCRLNGSIDYVRISDVALAPTDFLIGGDKGWHLRGGHRTVAYWPLDSKDGLIDGSNALGGSPLQMLVKSANKTDNFLQMRVSPDARKALSGSYPPNPNMTPAPTLDMPDNGSVRQHVAYGDPLQRTCLYDSSVASELSLTNDFTVEGWFRPERRYSPDDEYGNFEVLFAVDALANARWHLVMRKQKGETTRKFVIYAHDGTTALQSDVAFTGDAVASLDNWIGTWRHVALVHQADGGNGKGTWTLYLDGEAATTLEDAAEVKAGYRASTGFSIGGLWNSVRRAFCGNVDQVRVCRAALRPTQFLNAQANAEVATDVLRYWPLNVQDGVGVDGRDATGQGRDLSALWDVNQLPKAYASAPAITNPDPSVADRPSPAGCARFFDPREYTDAERRAKSSLATFDRATLDLFNSRRAMTLEYYYRSFSTAENSNTRCLLCFVDVPASGSWTWRGLFNYRDGAEKFHCQDAVYCGLGKDTKLGDVSMSYDGDWHHVAIVRALTADGFTYTFYHDGTACGSVSTDFVRDTPNKATALVFGGRWFNNSNSMDGALASLRVTEGALTTNEFLNAAPPEPVEPIRVLNEKLLELPMTKLNYGVWAAYDAAFTVEAKLPLPETVTDEVELFSAYATSPAPGVSVWPGWRLFLRPDGQVRFEAACGAIFGPFASGTFTCDLTPNLGKYVRLAVVYDPREGDGVWRLYRNAILIGTLDNLFSPLGTFSEITGTSFLPVPFTVGAGLSGSALDVRLTCAKVEPDALLRDRSTLVLVR